MSTPTTTRDHPFVKSVRIIIIVGALLIKKSEFKKKNKLLVRHQNIQPIKESLTINVHSSLKYDDVFFLTVCTTTDDSFDYPHSIRKIFFTVFNAIITITIT